MAVVALGFEDQALFRCKDDINIKCEIFKSLACSYLFFYKCVNVPLFLFPAFFLHMCKYSPVFISRIFFEFH